MAKIIKRTHVPGGPRKKIPNIRAEARNKAIDLLKEIRTRGHSAERFDLTASKLREAIDALSRASGGNPTITDTENTLIQRMSAQLRVIATLKQRMR